jgi:hypothetical protein
MAERRGEKKERKARGGGGGGRGTEGHVVTAYTFKGNQDGLL